MFDDMDDDDRPGYLMDYIHSWVKKHDIDSRDRFGEMFQSDFWEEEVINFAEQVLRISGALKDEK